MRRNTFHTSARHRHDDRKIATMTAESPRWPLREKYDRFHLTTAISRSLSPLRRQHNAEADAKVRKRS
jgi:hypothetical protein